jgi:uncharacterized protein (TIGR00255 family)
MSGFGRGASSIGNLKVTCEIRTVNHRHLDLSISLPSGLTGADPALRKLLSAQLGRGRAEVGFSVSGHAAGGNGRPVFDLGLAVWYGEKLKGLARRLRIKPPMMEALALLPGVISRPESPQGTGKIEGLAISAARLAITRVLAMRRREGRALAADLGGRLETIERKSSALGAEWPEAARRQAVRTDERLRLLLERLGEEKKGGAVRDLVAALERGDIAEELTRLHSHVAQAREALKAGSPAGRKLEFLVQEMQREANTAGAKSGDSILARIAVELKEEVERVREQVMNVE